jgi:hypothetical protein
VLFFLAVMGVAMGIQATASATREHGLESHHLPLLALQVLLASIFAYGALRMALTIQRLRRPAS